MIIIIIFHWVLTYLLASVKFIYNNTMLNMKYSLFSILIFVSLIEYYKFILWFHDKSQFYITKIIFFFLSHFHTHAEQKEEAEKR